MTPSSFIDKGKLKNKSLTELFNNELIDYFSADNYRSIPHLADGLKPSQRKILYTCLVKKYSDIKVSQLGGAVSEFTAYHQGENSLYEAIISMCQDFVGTNNIPLLIPDGQFGTRLVGGNDSASPRYIHTYLNPITSLIFKDEDLPILDYLEDDGKKIEPVYLLPIIPMILVNGSEGIGTGWSTKIPQYEPKKIVSWVERKLKGTLNPKFNENVWFNKFKGEITETSTKGVLKIVSTSKVRISELPIKVWTEKYCQFLDELVNSNKIKSYVNYSSDVDVNIEVNFTREDLATYNEESLMNLLKLESKLTYNNINTLSEKGIEKWDNVQDMLNQWYKIRYDGYVKRKQYTLFKMMKDVSIKKNKVDFIDYVIKGKIKIQNQPKVQILSQIEKLGLLKVNDSYDYLLSLPIYNLTKEKMEDIKKDYEKTMIEMKKYEESTIEQIWLEDIKLLQKQL
jgi:DNA topoisomerase-2